MRTRRMSILLGSDWLAQTSDQHCKLFLRTILAFPLYGKTTSHPIGYSNLLLLMYDAHVSREVRQLS